MEEEVRNEAESAEEPNAQPADEATDAAGGPQTNTEDLTDELFKELTVLGGRFVEVVQTAWNSDERRRIESDLKDGLTTVAESLEEGFQKVRENEQAQDVLDKADTMAESVGDKVRSSEAAQELGSSLLRGLNALAGQLEKWTEEMAAKGDSMTADAETDTDKSPEDDIQDIPIDQG